MELVHNFLNLVASNNGLESIDLDIFGLNFGQVDLSNFSLPIVTIVIGIIDGFNPCAMWILLFLISILIEEEKVWKRWLLGGIFLGVSGLAYFAFLTAWLNINLLIGLNVWVKILVSLVAFLVAVISLKDFQKEQSGCKVGDQVEKKELAGKIKGIIKNQNIWLASIGIAILALSVNIFELVCSAALPAVYTNLLASQDITGLIRYMYLGLYALFFMLDDLLIFGIAMFTLQATGISKKYNKWIKLISGIVMLILAFWLAYQVFFTLTN